MAKTLLCAGALTAAILTALPGQAAATTYEVGPGKTYANVGDAVQREVRHRGRRHAERTRDNSRRPRP